MSEAWRVAVRRGAVLLVLGALCLAFSLVTIEHLHGLLVGLGTIFLTLGLIVVVATGRALSADERRRSVSPGAR